MRSPTFAAVACTSDEDDDRVLVVRYLSGDRDAFTSLVVRYQRPIYNAAFWVLRKHEDAHDISQTVFLKVAERADEYDPKYKFFSWIYRIAVNECLNVKRGRRPLEALADQVDAREGPFEALDRTETRARVDAALKALTFEYREVIVLRHFADLSYEEIAEAVSAEPKTVKSRLFSARQKLAALLGTPEEASEGIDDVA